MYRVQKIVNKNPSYISTTYAEAGEHKGFKKGTILNLFQGGETLLYTQLTRYYDFELLGTRSVYEQGGRATTSLPVAWVTDHGKSGFVKAYYTEHGLFIRAYPGNEGLKDHE